MCNFSVSSVGVYELSECKPIFLEPILSLTHFVVTIANSIQRQEGSQNYHCNWLLGKGVRGSRDWFARLDL